MTDHKFEVLRPMESPSGFVVVPVHYSHDPDKTPEFIQKLHQSYDREEDWSREMEIDFTSQLGAAAYPSFNQQIHVKKGIPYRENLPLLLACDFNVDPCIFEICQIRGGRLYVIDEICLTPGNIPEMVREFRNRYPDHPAEVHVYGDTNGLTRTAQTEKSDYELIQIHMQGYTSRVVIKVPRKIPPSRQRINALNNRLKGYEGEQYIYISSVCTELIADFNQVVLRPDGKDVLKVYRPGNPYAQRTHASDAVGYLVHREWPIAREALKLQLEKKAKRKPMKYGKLLGEI
jgi:hypothetical protein